MSTTAFSHNNWAEWERDEARFQRTLLLVSIPFIIFGIIIPLWELSGLKEGGGEELSDRYAELLIQSAAEQEQPAAQPEPLVEEEPEPEAEAEPEPEAEPEAEPEPEPEPAETKTEPEPKPEPQVDAREQARQKVQQKFKSAFNALDSLRDKAPVVTASNRPLTQASSASEDAAPTASGVLTSDLARGSGGVSAAPQRSANTGSTQLSGRQSTKVDSVIEASGGYGADSSQPGFGGDSRLQGRSLEEIQIVMDRNKSGLYSLYNRALRRDATLQGKVVLQITIAPSGAVTDCKIVSSELGNPELESRILRRVKLINFGAKDVSEMTIKYPIHFIPS